MADTLKRLAGPVALTTTPATVYTVPSSTTAVIREIIVCNETGTARTFTLSIGTDGAGKRLFKDATVRAGETVQITGQTVLAAGEVIQAVASANSALTLTISGGERT